MDLHGDRRKTWTALDGEVSVLTERHLQPIAQQRQPVTGRNLIVAIEARTVVGHLEPQAIGGSNGSDDNRAALPTRGDSVLHAVFDQRLQRKLRDTPADQTWVDLKS